MTDENDGNGLFCGVEDAATDGGVERSPLAEGDSVDPAAWAADLTYAEVHSFTIGFGGVLLATTLTLLAVLLAPLLTPVAVATWFALGGLALVALGVRKLKTRTLRYIPKEPHYYLGGAAIALLLSIFAAVPIYGLAVVGGIA